MTSVLVELEALAIPTVPAELATELANTRDQLSEMVNELAGPGSGHS
jgi:hypothetical protein